MCSDYTTQYVIYQSSQKLIGGRENTYCNIIVLWEFPHENKTEGNLISDLVG